jgi:glycosyltransferase involved in cell wall biosynthesis
MTSHTEGSPQFVKEALACNCPVVSVNVGDVEELLDGVENCRIVERDANMISENLNDLLRISVRPDGNKKISESGLAAESVVEKIKTIYMSLVK